MEYIAIALAFGLGYCIRLIRVDKEIAEVGGKVLEVMKEKLQDRKLHVFPKDIPKTAEEETFQAVEKKFNQ